VVVKHRRQMVYMHMGEADYRSFIHGCHFTSFDAADLQALGL
jgi:hypothetical protein